MALVVVATVTLGVGACAKDAGSSGSSSSLTVDAGDSSCIISETELEAGESTFKVTNTGNKVTEFYLYASGDRIVGEVENIGPGLSRTLVVNLAQGSYEGACKPGMTGDGIRQKLTVVG